MSAFDLEYSVSCPLCAKENKKSKLGLIAGEGIRCDGKPSHEFEDVPEEETTAAPAAAEIANTLRPVYTEPETEPQVYEPVTGAEVDAVEVPTVPATESAQVQPHAPSGPVVEVAEGNEPLEAALYVPIPAGGGDVFLLCKFSEDHIQMFQNEAEAQGITLGEFMENWLLRAKENVWV